MIDNPESWKDIQGWFTWPFLYDWVAKHVGLLSNPPVFVEIGAWKGKSVAYLCDRLKRHARGNAEVYAVDPWSMDMPELNGPNSALRPHIEDMVNRGTTLEEEFHRNMRALGHRAMVRDCKMTALQALDRIERADFVFIDGDHSTEAVRVEAEEWSKRATVLAGHDAFQPSVGCGLTQAFGQGEFAVLPLLNCWTTHKPLADACLAEVEKQASSLVERIQKGMQANGKDKTKEQPDCVPSS